MKKHVFSLAIGLSLCLAAPAQSWRPLADAAAGNPDFASWPVSVLLDSTSVEVSPSGSGSFTVRRVVAIRNTKGALDNRVIKYDYDPLTAFAEFEDVKIYRADGTVESLDLSSACDYAAPARSIYWGARQIMIEPGALQAGDVVDYTISKKGFTYALLAQQEDERFIPPMRGQFYDIVPFWVEQPTVKKVYRVSFPKDKDVQYEFYQGQCASSVRFDGERKVMTFTVCDVLPFASEPNMADMFDVAPKLMMSSTPEWRDKSLWFYNVNEDYGSFEPTPEAQAKVDELLKGITDEMKRISILTHWVADNMRYSGISMGKGEGYTLHNTKMNFTDRCGVCKDKAALLISMLRMAGFEAYPAMTMAGSRIESIPADHFNHCVAVVKLANGTYMPLDPTWVPFNRELWSSAEQQQNYLPGVPEGSDLMLTPVSAPENHYFKIDATTSVDASGTLRGEFTLAAEGQSDAAVRRPFLQGYADRVMRALETELLRVSPQARLISVDCKNPKDYQAAPIKMKIRFEIPSYATVGDGVVMCRPLVGGNLYSGVRTFLRVDTAPDTRKYGFKDACSRYVEMNETMSLPQGYVMAEDAKEVHVKGEVAGFDGRMEQKDGKLIVRQSISLGKRVYDAEDWLEFRDAVNAYKNFASSTLVFEKR